MSNLVVIKKQEYVNECGDGCCHNFGEHWYVNDQLISSGPCDDTNLAALLKHLGIDAKIVLLDSEGQSVTEVYNTEA